MAPRTKLRAGKNQNVSTSGNLNSSCSSRSKQIIATWPANVDPQIGNS